MDGKMVDVFVEEQNQQGMAFDEIIENVIGFYGYQAQLAEGVVMDILLDMERKGFNN